MSRYIANVYKYFQYFDFPHIFTMAYELLILRLDLVKNRVGVMFHEMRKSFIGQILVGLIEKTSDPKVMKAITKMVEDWVKNKVYFYLYWSVKNGID